METSKDMKMSGSNSHCCKREFSDVSAILVVDKTNTELISSNDLFPYLFRLVYRKEGKTPFGFPSFLERRKAKKTAVHQWEKHIKFSFLKFRIKSYFHLYFYLASCLHQPAAMFSRRLRLG